MARTPYRKLSPRELEARGFSPTSERYAVPDDSRDPRAERGTISRRQAEQQVYTDAGWRSRADYERRYREGGTIRDNTGKMGRKLLYFESEAFQGGKGESRDIRRPNSEFNKRYLKARTFMRSGRRTAGPKSPMAKFLVYVGLRDPSATYNVGDTPRA